MKRSFLVLISFLLSSFLSVGNVQAGVPCSVPFNLTNGTTADATQVMANYNAILSCLSTSAAANGSNNDITALNGLTTPLTPTQAPGLALCGATGFTAINDTGTPATELDITYNEAIATNSLGAIQRGTSGSFVLNAGTTGANGLDTGALAASTNYYIWIISNGSTFATLLSLSSTAPTLPATYTYQCRVGAWYTNTALHFVTGLIRGRKFTLTQKPGGTGSNLNSGAFQLATAAGVGGPCGTANDTTVLTAFVGLPSTAVSAFGTLQTSNFVAVSSMGTATTQANEITNNGSVVTPTLFDLVLPAAESFYVCSPASSMTISVLGWTDNTNAN